MNKNQKIKLGKVVGVICVAVFVAWVGIQFGVNTAENDIELFMDSPITKESAQPIVIEVDGIGCVIAEAPVLTYYVATHTVRVHIECEADLLNHYLLAVAL